MLKNVSNQWKAEIIDAVGINEFTDMYIQAIRQYVREDLFTTEIPQSKFDHVLENEILDNIIAKLMNFVYQNEEDLKNLTISQQILLCRALLNDMDISKMDLKKINYESLDNDIEAISKGKKKLRDIEYEFIKDENVIKATCKELEITYRELGESIGYKPDTINKAASTGEVSDQLKKAIEMFIENVKLKKQLEEYEMLKHAIKCAIL